MKREEKRNFKTRKIEGKERKEKNSRLKKNEIDKMVSKIKNK